MGVLHRYQLTRIEIEGKYRCRSIPPCAAWIVPSRKRTMAVPISTSV